MRKILSTTLFALLFVSCKGNTKPENIKDLDDNLNTELVKAKDSSNKSVEENRKKASNSDNIATNYWAFYKISESSISGTPKKTKLEITNQFKNTKIEIDDKNLKVDDVCSYEYYKSNKTPIGYYESTKTAKLYESIFSKNGLKLENEITIYQSLYPEKACEIPWDEVLVFDNTLVIIYDDYLVFFKKGNNTDQNDCYSKTKITSLPITNSILNGNNMWNQLDCSIANLDTKDYLRLPDIKDVKVFIIGDFNFDNFTYVLVTLKNNKVISKKDIGFTKEGDRKNAISELTEFEINKDYVFSLSTKIKKGEDFKILKVETFKIDDNGLIVVIK